MASEATAAIRMAMARNPVDRDRASELARWAYTEILYENGQERLGAIEQREGREARQEQGAADT